jgi:hypothetical protein
MMKRKLHWKTPLFFIVLPILFVMVFLGFPLPVGPPPKVKAVQEASAPVRKKKRTDRLLVD